MSGIALPGTFRKDSPSSTSETRHHGRPIHNLRSSSRLPRRKSPGSVPRLPRLPFSLAFNGRIKQLTLRPVTACNAHSGHVRRWNDFRYVR